MSVTQITTVRRGFTLVELLVVIAIIGVLMGLLMPAIVNARLSALQATCANNERELAHAMILFDSNKDRLPFVGRADNSYSWYTQILEELGQGKLADNPTSQPMKQFKCPVGDPTAKGSSYIANTGRIDGTTSANPAKNIRGAGLLFFFKTKADSYTKSSISRIQDGASTTILVSEMVNRVPGSGSSFGTPDDWRVASDETFAKQHLGLNWDSANNPDEKILYPNFPTSRHSQVNNVAFADGSVRALSKAIKYSTFKSLMCPCDADAGVTANFSNDPNLQE